MTSVTVCTHSRAQQHNRHGAWPGWIQKYKAISRRRDLCSLRALLLSGECQAFQNRGFVAKSWPGLQQKAGRVRNIASNATCGLKTAFSRFYKQQKHQLLDLWTDKTLSFRGCASAQSQWRLSPGKSLYSQSLGTSPTPPQASTVLKVMATSTEFM